MLIIRQKMIYRTDLKDNPEILYIFGDNLERSGFGGQAQQMRGEPNSFGIATKRKKAHGSEDCYFHDSDHDVLNIVARDFEDLMHKMKEPKFDSYPLEYRWKAVVIPADGIGTGLACLHDYAPELLKHINTLLSQLSEI